SEIAEVIKELSVASITLDYDPNYSCGQPANIRTADLIKAWAVCKAAQLEFRLDLRKLDVTPLQLAQVAAANAVDELPSARLTITAIYGVQLIGKDECTADLTSKYKTHLAFNRLEEQSNQSATLLMRYRTARPELFLDLTLTLSRYTNRRFQYDRMKAAVLEWATLAKPVEQANSTNRLHLVDMPSETVIDVLCYCSRPDVDAFLLVGRAWHKAISKLSDALTLHMVDRCTVRSCVTRNERDVNDLTDVSFYVSLPGRRFAIPRLNMAASERDFERLRIALAHLRNAKIGGIDLPIEAGFPGLFKHCLGDGYVLNVGSVVIRNRDQLRFAVDSTNATKLVFYDHCCLELILGTTPCKRQVDLAIQQGMNANFFKDLVA
ncbi:hypothetical protein AAVH_40909, partial [Aphelenchoides avenae]